MALPKVWGYVAAEKNAQLAIDENQTGNDALVVKRVLAPTDAWVVVHLDDNGMPGDRVGLKHISKGESTDVEVPLKDVKSEKVIVAVHADKNEYRPANAAKVDLDVKDRGGKGVASEVTRINGMCAVRGSPLTRRARPTPSRRGMATSDTIRSGSPSAAMASRSARATGRLPALPLLLWALAVDGADPVVALEQKARFPC